MEVKINRYKLNYYIGYISHFYQYNIKDLNQKIINEDTLVKYFIILKPYWGDYYKLAVNASKKFGWNSLTTYYYYWHPKIQEYIFLEKSKQKQEKNLKEKSFILESVLAFVNFKRASNQQVFVNEVYKEIGKSDKYIRNKFPDIYELISSLAKESKIKQKERRIKELKRIILEIYNEYGKVDLDILSQRLGVSIGTLKSGLGIYKRIGKLIRETIAEFQKN